MNDRIDALLQDFKNKCLVSRAFVDCELLELLRNNFKNIELILKKDTITYRARAYKDPKYSLYAKFMIHAHPADENDLVKNPNLKLGELVGFCGYNKEDSFVNPNKHSIDDGRCNYKYSQCLYSADSERVAISEIKPLIREVVSVAKIKSKEDLKLLDLRRNSKNSVVNAIADLFVQSPTLENPDAYIYSQVVSSYVRNHGYDGILYSSCQVVNGGNYAIFNFDKCEAISSELYDVDDIKIVARKK